MDSQQLATGKTSGDAGQVPDRLHRCIAWVQECKRAVSELRSEVKAAVSHREKCCMTLSAAMAAVLALESLVYSGNMNNAKEQQLQRLCAKLTSTLDLATARVKTYGQQSRVQKYCKFFRRQHMLDKFDSTIQQLDEHSETAWKLQDSDMVMRRRGMRASFTKGPSIYSSPSLSADSAGPRDSTVLDSADCADTSLLNDAALARCRLRRGTRHNGVRCMVFINPKTSSHAGSAGHVWWYVAGPMGGNLYMHDLNEGSLQEIEEARKDPPLSVMHHDKQGHVWVGHKRGTLRVWSDTTYTPVSASMKCFHADVRVIVTDEQGTAWVGSESGNVRRVTLKQGQDPNSTQYLSLEVAQTFKRNSSSRSTSQRLGSSSMESIPDDFSRVDSAHPTDDPLGSDEGSAGGSTGGLAGGLAGVKAHAGPVSAIEIHKGRVFTSGGTQSSAALIEWDSKGVMVHTHNLKELGVARAIRVVDTRQKARASSNLYTGESSDSIRVSATGTSQPDTPGSPSPRLATQEDDFQVLTAHDNGQVQVWGAGSGWLQPVFRIGQAGPAARCLVVCPSLGIFATAHADGSLNLRLLPSRSPADRVSPPTDQTPAAQIKAHRSGLVLAIGANTGIITCGIFGSVMWWPEAELRSTFQAAGLSLPGEERRSGDQNANMSQLLRRYFTPSSAVLAQATLRQMHSRGTLQVADTVPSPVSHAMLEDSVDLDDPPEYLANGSGTPTTDGEEPVKAGPPPLDSREQQHDLRQHQEQNQHQYQYQEQQQQQLPTQTQQQQQLPQGRSGSPVLDKVSTSGAASVFMAEVSRILEQGTACHESTEAMTDKIAHAASLTHLPSLDSGDGSAIMSQPPSARASGDADPASPARQASGIPQRISLNSGNRFGAPTLTADAPTSPVDLQQQNQQLLQQQQQQTQQLQQQQERQQQRLLHDQQQRQHQQWQSQQQAAAQAPMPQPLVSRRSFGVTTEQARRSGTFLRKSSSMDKDNSAVMAYVQGIQRSASTNETLEAPNSWAAEPDSKAGGLMLSDSGTVGRASGSSSFGSGIFGDQGSQWVIEYTDLSFRKVIGEGSIGRVHLGRWQETDVAIKLLSIGGALQPVPSGQGQVASFEEDDTELDDEGSDQDLVNDELAVTVRTLEREVAIMSAIRHPNVVLFMGVCLDPPCMVTEFCARGSLFDVLAKARASPLVAQQLDWPKRVGMALDAAKGMLQLHSHKPPILHRDLKSPNLLVDKHWRVKVADFNLSRVMEAQAVVSSISANNPRWLAPEVVTQQHYSKAADVYSFGLILWELLTWQLPWADLGPFQIMIAITEKQRRPDIPEEAELPGGSFAGLSGYLQLMDDCWQDDAMQRPTFELVIVTLRGLLEQAMTNRSLQKAASSKARGAKTQSPSPTAALPAAPSAPPPAVPAANPQLAHSASQPGRASAPGGPSSAFQPPASASHAATVGASLPRLEAVSEQEVSGSWQESARSRYLSERSSQDAARLAQGMNLQQLQSNLLRPATEYSQIAAAVAQRPEGTELQPPSDQQQSPSASEGDSGWTIPFSAHQQPSSSDQDSPNPSQAPHQQWQDAMSTFHQPVPFQHNSNSDLASRPGLQTWHEGRTSGDARRLDTAAQAARASNDFTENQLLAAMLPGASVEAKTSGANKSAGFPGISDQPRPPRQSMPARPQLLAALRGAKDESSGAMSPFGGFVALSKGRSSMDAGDANSSFTANAHRHRRKSVHIIEDVVGRDKVMKQVPRHIRQSLDRTGSEAGRKSHEFLQPPPAQSTGMRNSSEAGRPDGLERAASIPPRAQERHRLSSDRPSRPQAHHADPPDPRQPSEGVAFKAPPAPSSVGLSQYSPFASQGPAGPETPDN